MKKSVQSKKIVKRYLEHVPIGELMRVLKIPVKQDGIYILYKKTRNPKHNNGSYHKIIYIGSSKGGLFNRINSHKTDLRGLWDNFSFYQIKRRNFIRDLETFCIRISDPPMNRDKSRKNWTGKYDLGKRYPF